MKKVRLFSACLIAGSAWISSGCNSTTTTTTVTANGLPSGPPEKAYCPYLPSKTSFGASSLVTITGSAGYISRQNGIGQSGTLSGSTKPIRFAEIRVTDSSGSLIQCGEMDGSGGFTFAMPQSANTYHVAVVSRASNTNIQASVLNRPEYNEPYEVGIDFTPDATKTLAQIVAQADQTIDAKLSAGAFNILDDIYKANHWINTQTSGCNDSSNTAHYISATCQPFTVAPKITAYWTAGFNPGTYFPDSSGDAPAISFYLPGQSILMILGGLNGDVDTSDNDQFDDSVIIHEYGHFIEDRYAKTNSPGGSHDGNSIIDPRLAWGEGWANFFQAAVTGNPVYRDTHGTSAGSFGVYFNEDLTTQNQAQTTADVSDIPLTTDEGIYREFAITRALWGIIAPHPVTNQISQEVGLSNGLQVPFSELWYLFTDTTSGFKSTAFHFRNLGLWLYNQTSLGREDLSAIRSDEKQNNHQSQYSIPFTLGACANTNTITAVKSGWDSGSFDTSNLARSNHFYHISHAGGPLNIHMTWNSSGQATELDLYMYNEDYRYGDSTTMAGYNNASNACSSGCTKDLNLNVGAGDYLLNVMVYTGNNAGSATTYNLNLNGTLMCPNP